MKNFNTNLALLTVLIILTSITIGLFIGCGGGGGGGVVPSVPTSNPTSTPSSGTSSTNYNGKPGDSFSNALDISYSMFEDNSYVKSGSSNFYKIDTNQIKGRADNKLINIKLNSGGVWIIEVVANFKDCEILLIS